ncbi:MULTISPECIES: hypothetical protein [unclassified Bradyrhizobium]|uniref:hypothetical protein n=1 Tax=unclassified Bradyrhizobium TaxID=2631580 RepID=UPI00211E4A99|nr:MULTISPECIES: hypothetical protein [unclassified Bradyrhizobium]MDD1534574.1 hypothetical protein [Bradyrhizobium sp. WBOS8]MDD1581438.1 hypothetical protein [Bradyrhizobium sp. WBOS4]UUO49726.1 hypothetical protein DCM78_24130 [Bradyrhizobium sp. WBOS04]UUO58492.1 hypothetical protein DCM80_04410 [Bradyrhizobium sp. WBOS08]
MQRIILLAAIVCVFAVVVIGLPAAIGGSPCDDKQIGACVRDWIKDVLLPAAALLAAVLAGYFAFGQMKAAQAQLSLAQNSSRVQLRAYLSVSQADVNFDDRGAFAKIQVKNSGTTPSYDVDIRLWLTGTNDRNYSLEQVVQPGTSPSVLGPGGTAIKIQRHDLTAEQLSQILDGRAWLFVHGYVTFADIFSESRRLDFLYEASKEADGHWRLKTTREGNRSRDLPGTAVP